MPHNDLIYPHIPIITAEHVAGLRRVRSLWGFPGEVDPSLLDDMIAHFDALLAAPVPQRTDGNDSALRQTLPNPAAVPGPESPPPSAPVTGRHWDWRNDFQPIAVEECYDCD